MSKSKITNEMKEVKQSVTGKPVNCRIRSITETSLSRPAIVCLALLVRDGCLVPPRVYLDVADCSPVALLMRRTFCISWSDDPAREPKEIRVFVCASDVNDPTCRINLEQLIHEGEQWLNDRRTVNDAKANFSLNDEKISNCLRLLRQDSRMIV